MVFSVRPNLIIQYIGGDVVDEKHIVNRYVVNVLKCLLEADIH